MRIRTIGLGLGCGLLAATTWAQAPQELRQSFEKAKLLEGTGQDFARAAELYRGVAKAGVADASLKTAALYRLAMCLQAMRKDAAATAALQEAAKGQGPDAESAKKLLSGQNATDQDALRTSIQRAVSEYLRGIKSARSDLNWLGEAAVPELVNATRTYRYDRDKMRRLVSVICSLGGPLANKFFEDTLASEDVLYRRAVASGISTNPMKPSGLDDVLVRFTKDPDSEVRGTALRSVGRLLDHDQLFAHVQSASSSEEIGSCMMHMRGKWHELSPEEQSRRFTPISEWILSRWDAADKFQRQTLSGFFQQPFAQQAYAVPAGRRGMVRCLTDLANGQVLNTYRFDWDKEPGLSPAEFAPLFEKLGRYTKASGGGRGGNRHFRAWFLAQAEFGSWDHRAMPLLLDLAEKGYDEFSRRSERHPKLSEWMLSIARPQDLPVIARVLPKLEDPRRVLAKLQKCEGFDACAPALVEVANELSGRKLSSAQKQLMGALPGALLANGNEQSLQLLMKMTEAGQIHRTALIRGLCSWESGVALPALRQLALDPKTDRNARHQAMVELLVREPGTYAEVLPRAFDLGINAETDKKPWKSRGLSNKGPAFFWGPESEGSIRWTPRIPAEQLAKVIDRTLATAQGTEAIVDLLGLAKSRLQVTMPDEVLEALARRIPESTLEDCVDLGLKVLVEYPDRILPARIETCRTLLSADAPHSRRAALYHIRQTGLPLSKHLVPELTDNLRHEERGVWTQAMQVLSDVDDERAFKALTGVARKEGESYRRARAVWWILQSPFRDRAEPMVLELLEDSDSGVQQAAISGASALLSRKAVPGLLKLLRVPGLRKQARDALESIRYYYEQQAHWKKWLEGSGLDAKSPAEALIEQAQKGKSAKVRVYAVRSLGSLADPTTLPFLISLMEGKDEDLAKAAAAAVEQIHAKLAK